MAKFLDTDKAYAEIVDIVSKANTKLVLISPYIKIPESLLERLKYMDGKGIKTVVVCRKKRLTDEVRSDLKQLKNLELRFNENLHAKCFYNEQSMVITSLNLYEYSQQHNREMGVLLSFKDDRGVFEEARKEAEFIVNRAEKESFVKGVIFELTKERTIGRKKSGGFCIRCGKHKSYNTNFPYCRDCFREWEKDKNRANIEKFCHRCGNSANTSVNEPLCPSCLKKTR